MNKLPFEEMNELTRLFNQQGNPLNLVEMIRRTAKTTTEKSFKIAKEFCYAISLILNLWFSDKTKEDVKLSDIFDFIFDNLYFVKSRNETEKPGSYQMKSSYDILSAMFDSKLIGPFEFKDIDFGKWVDGVKMYSDEARKKAYNKLISRMDEDDFNCARVCFGQDSSSDHAILVCKDSENRKIVIDTSWRGHNWPQNDINRYITEKNMIWFTEII